MAFDFPASPTTGQVSNGYTYNGVGWIGGPGIAGPVTDQWFDLSGLTSKDISVPTWAKSVKLIGFGGAATSLPFMRWSMDGTTFLATSGDYYNAGAVFNSGTSNYQAIAQAAANAIQLAITADNASFFSPWEAQLMLTRATVSSVINGQVLSRTLDSSAGAAHRGYHGAFFGTPASGLAIKALRILSSSTAFPAGSSVQVQWLGDSAAIPQTNAIADAPSDNGEYVRVNGVWRLKGQTFAMATTGVDIPVPTGATVMRYVATVFPVASPCSLASRVSFDGTTFLAGATDYQLGGFGNYSGSTANASVPLGNSPQMNMSGNVVTIGYPIACEGHFELVRPSNSYLFSGLTRSSVFGTATTVDMYQYIVRNLVSNANAGTNTAIKALRYFPLAGTFAAGSQIAVQWDY